MLAAAIAGRFALEARQRRVRATTAALAADQGAQIATSLVQSAGAAWDLPADVRARLEAAADSLQERAAESERLQGERAESLRAAVDTLSRQLEQGIASMTAASDALHRRLNERVAAFERQILGAVDAARAGEEEVRREIGQMRAALTARSEAERAQLDAAAGRTTAGLDTLGARLTELRASIEASTGDQLADLRNDLDQQVHALEGRSANELGRVHDDLLAQLRAAVDRLSQQAAQAEAARSDRSVAFEQQINRSTDATRASVDGVRKELREMQGALALRLKAVHDATTQHISDVVKAASDESAHRAAESDRLAAEWRRSLDEQVTVFAADARKTAEDLRGTVSTALSMLADRTDAADGRLAEATDRLSATAQERIAEVRSAVEQQLKEVSERLGAGLDAVSREGREREAALTADLRSFSEHIVRSVDATRAEAERLTRALPEVASALVERLEADRGERAADAEKQRADLVAATAEQLTRVRTSVEDQLTTLRSSVGEQTEALRAQSAAELRRAVGELQAALNARMDAESGERATNAYTVRAALDSLAARAAELEHQQQTRLEDLSHALMDALDTAATRTTEARADLTASTAERIAALRTALDGRLGSIQAQTESELAHVREQLRTVIDAFLQQAKEAEQRQAESAGSLQSAIDSLGARLADVAHAQQEAEQAQGDRVEALSAHVERAASALEGRGTDDVGVRFDALTERVDAARREMTQIREDLLLQVQAARDALVRQSAEWQHAERERSASLGQQVSSSADMVRTSGEIIHALRSAFDTLMTRVTELEGLQRDTLNDMREIRRQRGASYWERQH